MTPQISVSINRINGVESLSSADLEPGRGTRR